MGEATCRWSDCGSSAETALEGCPLCRNHFYDLASRRLEEHRERLQRIAPEQADCDAISKFLNELIGQATTLVASSKLLSPWQRDQFFELSLSAAELYKRVKRNPSDSPQ